MPKPQMAKPQMPQPQMTQPLMPKPDMVVTWAAGVRLQGTLVGKVLTKADVEHCRVVLPRLAMEANMPEVVDASTLHVVSCHPLLSLNLLPSVTCGELPPFVFSERTMLLTLR